MRAIKLALFVFVLVLALLAAFALGEMMAGRGTREAADVRLWKEVSHNASYDGRFGTQCGGQPCFVPFARLIAQPERYHDMQVATIGFFKIIDGDMPLLFPSEESVKTRALFENIMITSSIPADLAAKAQQGVWVRVQGRLDATASGTFFSMADLDDVTMDEWRLYPRPTPPPPQVHLRTVTPPRAQPPVFETAPEEQR